MEQRTIVVDRTTLHNYEDIIPILISLCDEDWDMSGENGDEYTWDEALENGYDSSAEYLADTVVCNVELQNLTTMAEVLEASVYEFFNNWMGRDSYYEDYAVSVTHVDATTVITYTWVSEV